MKNTPSWFQYPQHHWQTKHATIIGGGIAGAQMAWHLCQEGWQVTLIERHDALATEASGNPAGVITPKMTAQASLGEDFYRQSFHYTLSQLASLKQAGHHIDMDNCGALQLAHNAREEKRWNALKQRNLSTDFIQLLDEDQTESVAGIKLHADKGYKSCYFPQGAWINPASLVKALVDHPHCNIITQTEALTLQKQDSSWQVFNNRHEVFSDTEVVIIASGKDIFSFEQSRFLPGMPVAGQTTSAKASEFSKKLKTVIGHEGYLTPAIGQGDDATHIFGATFDRDVSKPNITNKSDNENLNKLKQYLPAFADSLNDMKSAHVAVRMTTPDRFPYVGAIPDIAFYKKHYHDLHQGKQFKTYPDAEYKKGLFVLGGLGSRGIITSGFSAKALTDLLENRLDSVESQQLLLNCHPARFVIKHLKRGFVDSH